MLGNSLDKSITDSNITLRDIILPDDEYKQIGVSQRVLAEKNYDDVKKIKTSIDTAVNENQDIDYIQQSLSRSMLSSYFSVNIVDKNRLFNKTSVGNDFLNTGGYKKYTKDMQEKLSIVSTLIKVYDDLQEYIQQNYSIFDECKSTVDFEEKFLKVFMDKIKFYKYPNCLKNAIVTNDELIKYIQSSIMKLISDDLIAKVYKKELMHNKLAFAQFLLEKAKKCITDTDADVRFYYSSKNATSNFVENILKKDITNTNVVTAINNIKVIEDKYNLNPNANNHVLSRLTLIHQTKIDRDQENWKKFNKTNEKKQVPERYITNPKVSEVKNIGDYASPVPFITFNGVVIFNLTRDQYKIIQAFDKMFREGVYYPMSIALKVGGGKSYLDNIIQQVYGNQNNFISTEATDNRELELRDEHDNIIGYRLPSFTEKRKYSDKNVGQIKIGDNTFELPLLSPEQQLGRSKQAKIVHLSLVGINGAISKEEIEKRVEKEIYKAFGSKEKYETFLRNKDGNKANTPVIFMTDEFYNLPFGAQDIIREKMLEIELAGYSVSDVNISATPNLGILGVQKDKLLEKGEKTKAEELGELVKEREETDGIFKQKFEEVKNIKLIKSTKKNPITISKIFKEYSFEKDKNKNVQLLLPSVDPEDLTSIIDTSFLKKLFNSGIEYIFTTELSGEGYKTVLRKIAKSNDGEYQIDALSYNQSNDDIEKANGKALMIYTSNNYIGGDYGMLSRNVGKQIIYSPSQLDTYELQQMFARYRKEGEQSSIPTDNEADKCERVIFNPFSGAMNFYDKKDTKSKKYKQNFLENAKYFNDIREKLDTARYIKHLIKREMLLKLDNDGKIDTYTDYIKSHDKYEKKQNKISSFKDLEGVYKKAYGQEPKKVFLELYNKLDTVVGYLGILLNNGKTTIIEEEGDEEKDEGTNIYKTRKEKLTRLSINTGEGGKGNFNNLDINAKFKLLKLISEHKLLTKTRKDLFAARNAAEVSIVSSDNVIKIKTEKLSQNRARLTEIEKKLRGETFKNFLKLEELGEVEEEDIAEQFKSNENYKELYNDLKVKNEELEKKYKALKKQHNLLVVEEQKLKDKIKKLKEELTEKSGNEANELRKKLESKEDELKEVQIELNEVRENINKNKEEVEKFGILNNKLKTKVGHYKKKNEKLERQNKELLEKNNVLEKELNNTKDLLGASEKQLISKNAELDNTKQQLDDKEKELKKITKEKGVIQKHLKQLEEELIELRNNKTTDSSKNNEQLAAQKEQEINELKSKIEEFETKERDFEKGRLEYENLKKEHDKLKTSFKELEDKNKDIEEKLKLEIQAERKLIEELATLKLEKEDLEQKLEKEKQDDSNLKDQIKALNNTIIEKENGLKQKQAEIENLKKESEELKGKVDQLNNDILNLTNTINESKKGSKNNSSNGFNDNNDDDDDEQKEEQEENVNNKDIEILLQTYDANNKLVGKEIEYEREENIEGGSRAAQEKKKKQEKDVEAAKLKFISGKKGVVLNYIDLSNFETTNTANWNIYYKQYDQDDQPYNGVAKFKYVKTDGTPCEILCEFDPLDINNRKFYKIEGKGGNKQEIDENILKGTIGINVMLKPSKDLENELQSELERH